MRYVGGGSLVSPRSPFVEWYIHYMHTYTGVVAYPFQNEEEKKIRTHFQNSRKQNRDATSGSGDENGQTDGKRRLDKK